MKKVVRLFAQFAPEHYGLQLAIDPETMVFEGSVVISGRKVGRPSKRLTFHQNDVKITSAEVTYHQQKNEQTIEIERLNHHSSLNEVRLHSKTTLYPGRYTITLRFNGRISRQMNGLYPCFFEQNGKKQKLIATQFESHHAREVFPCIDEPEAKATFELTLITPKDQVLLSNTPIREQKPEGKTRQLTVFQTTPKMSTYLLAFVWGNLKHREAKTKDGVLVRTYATPDNVQHTAFALDIAVKCLEFYNDYFGIKYPLPKCDLIALPDFAAGAMENWGCITFREQAMLVDPKNTTLASKQYVALVVAHELAHQWFGNLVTMRWWTDLWLNEGFASWIEYLAIDKLFPDWHLWTQFIVDEQQQALKLDALANTHPIEVTVNHPDEIRTIFDTISYGKGASAIHMLHNYLGAEAFRAGLRYYLKEHEYGNTDTVDLWRALEEASERSVRRFMHDWTSQSGFPLVRANVENDEVTVSQQRFFASAQAAKSLAHSQTWPVPLLANSNELPETLTKAIGTYKQPKTGILKLNSNQSGFYRVVYNASYLEQLAEKIKEGRLSPLDRLGILSDASEAAKAGYIDTLSVLHFLEAYRNEDSYAVWDIIASLIGSIRLVMHDDSLREAMKPYIRRLVEPQLKRLGWERKTKESHFDSLMRPIVLGLAASADEPSIVKRCLESFDRVKHAAEVAPDLRSTPPDAQLRRGATIDPDLRGVVFGTTARHGNKKTFEKLVILHNESTLSEERNTIAAALTGFEQPELIGSALKMITTDDVRLQDVVYWVAYSFLNRHAKMQTWQWLIKQWPWLEENLGTDLSFYRMPVYAGRAFSDRDFLKTYKDFFYSVMSPALDRSTKQGIEIIEWQADWKKRDLKAIKAFFKS